MRHQQPATNRSGGPARRLSRAALLFASLILGPGCAAVSNPVADGIPARMLPDELRGKSREGLKPIPLTMLRQKPIEVHTVGAGDILGIAIENVTGERNAIPPVRLDAQGGSPAIGYPILVQDDGTISLSYVPPIKVEGLTLVEVKEKIRKTYVTADILNANKERIIVSLYQARKFHVLVMREDGGTAGVQAGPTFGVGSPVIGASKKGTGYPLDLLIGENDVLNALAKTGGLPGTDAKNEVTIYKKKKKNGEQNVIHIPLRMRQGETPPFNPEDVILDNGDIVYLESRDTEVFYTAGLIGTGQYPLPRDTDLNIIQAITQVRGPLLNGGFGQAQFVANSINSGLGQESPSLVSVLRKTASGRQLTIRIDINNAWRDPRERILVLPGDIIVLQEKPGEAVARYGYQTFRISFTGLIRSMGFTGSGVYSGF